MVGENQLQIFLSEIEDIRRVSLYDHPFGHLLHAGSLPVLHPFYFHQTHPAAADLADVFEKAERRDLDVHFLGRS